MHMPNVAMTADTGNFVAVVIHVAVFRRDVFGNVGVTRAAGRFRDAQIMTRNLNRLVKTAEREII